MHLTEPEFSSRISKPSGIFSPVAIKVHRTVFTSLNHLKYGSTEIIERETIRLFISPGILQFVQFAMLIIMVSERLERQFLQY